MRLLDQFEWMPDAGEIRLRGVGEQIPGGWIRAREQLAQTLVIQPQLRSRQRRVNDQGSFGAGELADAVDGVVIVGGEEQRPTPRKRVRLADVLERRGRVLGEDSGVVVTGVEPR